MTNDPIPGLVLVLDCADRQRLADDSSGDS
jgi:hypothetical protein